MITTEFSCKLFWAHIMEGLMKSGWLTEAFLIAAYLVGGFFHN
jgi:hypothetical protein